MSITPQEARATLTSLLDDTQSLIGGEWNVHDSPSPVPCPRGGAAEPGVAFTGHRTLDGGGGFADIAAPTTALWEAAGLRVGRTAVGPFDVLRGVHPSDPAFTAELRVGARSTMLRGQSPCAEGDAIRELERVKRELGTPA